jgi:hypothetical protein
VVEVVVGATVVAVVAGAADEVVTSGRDVVGSGAVVAGALAALPESSDPALEQAATRDAAATTMRTPSRLPIPVPSASFALA